MQLLYILILLLGMPAMAVAESQSEPESKTLVWSDGTRYVGGVKDGKRSGKGTIFWQDGTRFVGSFANDLRNGAGTMILPDGTVYKGIFKNDTLVDNGTSSNTVSSNQTTPSSSDALDSSTYEKSTVENSPARNIKEAANSVANTQPIVEQAIKQVAAKITPEPKDQLTPALKLEAESMVKLWAAAWSEQNVPQYLAYYSDSFKVPGNRSRTSWEALRRQRLTKPNSISVSVNIESVSLDRPDRATIRFNQIYRSDLYKDMTRKEMRLAKEGEFWRILNERSL